LYLGDQRRGARGIYRVACQALSDAPDWKALSGESLSALR
jgi:hypothetical protein